MATSLSAKKRIRQNKKSNIKNTATVSKINTLAKKIQKQIEEGKKEDLKKDASDFYKAVDKASKQGVIKKNTADRKKSRVMKAINKAK